MNISLTPEFEQFIQKKLDSGLYYSASEVVREALRLLEQRDQLEKIKLEELRAAIRESLASGEIEGFTGQTFDEIRAEVRKKASKTA